MLLLQPSDPQKPDRRQHPPPRHSVPHSLDLSSAFHGIAPQWPAPPTRRQSDPPTLCCPTTLSAQSPRRNCQYQQHQGYWRYRVFYAQRRAIRPAGPPPRVVAWPSQLLHTPKVDHSAVAETDCHYWRGDLNPAGYPGLATSPAMVPDQARPQLRARPHPLASWHCNRARGSPRAARDRVRQDLPVCPRGRSCRHLWSWFDPLPSRWPSSPARVNHCRPGFS